MKVVAIRSQGGSGCEISYDVLPDGVANFAHDAFLVARYDGSHYDLLADSGDKKSSQYTELPDPIRERLVGQGFYAAISCVPKMRPPRSEPPAGAQTLHHPTPRKTEADRAACIRTRAMEENPLRNGARRRDAPTPERHNAGKMDTPRRYCGALRWQGEVARTSICCIACNVQIQEIQEPPEPTLSLIRGTHEDSIEFRANIREYNALMSFASIGGGSRPRDDPATGALCVPNPRFHLPQNWISCGERRSRTYDRADIPLRYRGRHRR